MRRSAPLRKVAVSPCMAAKIPGYFRSMALRSLLLMTLLTVHRPDRPLPERLWFDPDDGSGTSPGWTAAAERTQFSERLTFGGNGAFQVRHHYPHRWNAASRVSRHRERHGRHRRDVLLQRFKGHVGTPSTSMVAMSVGATKLFTRVFVHVESEHINIEAFGPLLPEAGRRRMDQHAVGRWRVLSRRDRPARGRHYSCCMTLRKIPLNPYDNPTIRGRHCPRV